MHAIRVLKLAIECAGTYTQRYGIHHNGLVFISLVPQKKTLTYVVTQFTGVVEAGLPPNTEAVPWLSVLCAACLLLLIELQEAALSMKMHSQYTRGGTLV